jgi:hypothetical protein
MNILDDVSPGKNNPIYRTILIVSEQVNYKEDVPADDIMITKDVQGN